MAPIVNLMKLVRRLSNRQRPIDIKNTQVAKLGLLEISRLPDDLANRRSLTSLAEAAEKDELEQ